jgi:endonuclease/exonuclease/phosphatase family metal-dependent hydrolase
MRPRAKDNPREEFGIATFGPALSVSQMLRLILLALLFFVELAGAGQFSVGTYNLELYLKEPSGTMRVKPEAAKAKVVEMIKAINVDVLAVQEMGSPEAFAEFQAALRAAGLNYPHTEYVRGADSTLHVAVLSRFPITAHRSHTNASFLLNGRRHRVLRGFAEVDIRVEDRYNFTLLAAHLKSKRQTGLSDEEDVREQEALLLREKVDSHLLGNPAANLIVVGDLNDFRNARSTRAIIGRGKNVLIDTRPAERNGDSREIASEPNSARQITWTHYYALEDNYSRLDYILVSRGMSREWLPELSFVLAAPNWGVASDHRPVVATFTTVDK